MLFVKAPRRGDRTRLLIPDVLNMLDEEAREITRGQADLLTCEWIQQKQFEGVINWRFHRKAHINLQGFKVVGTLLKRLARRPASWHMRSNLLVDSLVACGALCRGRSSSRRLNRFMRGTLPYSLPCQIRLLPAYCPTDLNPADDGTRGRAVRRAAAPDPAISAVVAAVASQHSRALRCSQQGARVHTKGVCQSRRQHR